MEQFSKFRLETLEGIKVYVGDAEWVLIYPDPDTVMFHIVAEARSTKAAQKIVAKYSELVRRLGTDPGRGTPIPAAYQVASDTGV
jgi:phosphomannomutase